MGAVMGNKITSWNLRSEEPTNRGLYWVQTRSGKVVISVWDGVDFRSILTSNEGRYAWDGVYDVVYWMDMNKPEPIAEA